jgi:hypothetical protein
MEDILELSWTGELRNPKKQGPLRNLCWLSVPIKLSAEFPFLLLFSTIPNLYLVKLFIYVFIIFFFLFQEWIETLKILRLEGQCNGDGI